MPEKKPQTVMNLVSDPKAPHPIRRHVMLQVMMDESPPAVEAQSEIFKRLTEASAHELYVKKSDELDKLIQEIKAGPLRRATYLGYCPSIRRAEVILDDGTPAYVAVPDESLLQQLECGSSVFVDANCQAIAYVGAGKVETGEEATFNSRIEGTNTVRVEFRDEAGAVMRVSADLGRQIEKGQVAPGRKLLVCSRRLMAFAALPEDKGVSHFRFLMRQAPPDVCLDRDVGCPPRYIRAIEQHVRIHMLRPDLAERWRIPGCRFFLLEGLSGTGKSHSLYAVWNMLYQLMSEITGIPVSDLPYCVTRLFPPEFLSKWLGDSDKNINRFFDENEQLADRVFTAPNGKKFHLPIFSILEEFDGIARARGEEPIYDRILSTVLQRLDKGRPELRSRLIIFVGSTNVVGQCDPAAVRRIGARVERFGHLDRRGFTQVLMKRLRDLPLAGENGDPLRPRQRLVSNVTAWLFSPNGSDPGQVELTIANSAEKVLKYRRDFLTGAVVDRAVEDACGEACNLEFDQSEQGLDAEMLMLSLDNQIRAVANQITPHNVTQYVAVPEGARVAAVRRIEQPAVLPMDLLRIS
jgi:hypothetical protein